MVVGAADCCAIKTCGHGEIWHPTCCHPSHNFVPPLVVEGKVILVGDKFYYNFPGEKDFPNDPKGWVQCTLRRGSHGRTVVKPKGHELFIIGIRDPAQLRLNPP